ncbi:MAG: asparagine synthase (glutamine-hydrolyzing) [Bacteroidota bacterium]
MCRIAGIISKELNIDVMREKTRVMCQALQHGGPDNEGVFYVEDPGLAFGHRRLSIIDLSSNGHQPMADIHKKVWITFNGEIYNYLQLKADLIKIGAQFYSDTDTEVILQAYLCWGTDAFTRLRGMFAFALYDAERSITYLARDSMGVKPLYYHVENGQLSFASEVKALQSAQIATQHNTTWLIKFLAYGHVPEPDTTLQNVFSLPKGNFLCWHHHDSSYKIAPYIKTVTQNTITNINDAQLIISQAFKDAIGRQLVADAPIGVFLSGGIDSSLVTLLANQHTQQLKTVSLFFNEKEYDESAYQTQIADQIQGDKFTHLIKQQDFEDSFRAILNAMDMPTTDGINTWFISKYAHQDGLKAVLSGIGGDELFGGYPSFNRIKFIQYLRMAPSSILKSASHFLSDRFKKIAFLTNNNLLADYLFLRGLFAPDEIAEILNCSEQEVYQVLFSTSNILDPEIKDQKRASWFETNLYMQNQLLRDTDVMSMNHGLEVRVPFLDEDFYALVNSIAPGVRFDKNIPKKLLIDSFKDILPASIWNRPKMGFSFPLQQWMKANEQISNDSLYPNKKAKSVIKHFKDDKVHWSKAFALYQIQKHV